MAIISNYPRMSSFSSYLDVRHGSLTSTFQSLPRVEDRVQIVGLLVVCRGLKGYAPSHRPTIKTESSEEDEEKERKRERIKQVGSY